MSVFVTIPNSNLAEALATVRALGLVLGKNCRINFPAYSVTARMSAIDEAIADSMDERDTVPKEDESSAAPKTQRIEQTIYLTDSEVMQLRDLDVELTTVPSSANRSVAWQSYQRQKREVREAAVAPFVLDFVTPGSTLIYGPMPIKDAETIAFADGRRRDVHTLIHWSRPTLPEEMLLRECHIKASVIVDFKVHEIDPVMDIDDYSTYRLTPDLWRDIIKRRIFC